MKRHLAAILAADVAGYSRIMADDEAATLAALQSCLSEVVEPHVGRHGGRIFKTIGDGFLAEFPSVVEAVGCAGRHPACHGGAQLARRNAAAPVSHRRAPGRRDRRGRRRVRRRRQCRRPAAVSGRRRWHPRLAPGLRSGRRQAGRDLPLPRRADAQEHTPPGRRLCRRVRRRWHGRGRAGPQAGDQILPRPGWHAARLRDGWARTGAGQDRELAEPPGAGLGQSGVASAHARAGPGAYADPL